MKACPFWFYMDNRKEMSSIYVCNVADDDWRQYYKLKVTESFDSEPAFITLEHLQGMKVSEIEDSGLLIWCDSFETFSAKFPLLVAWIAQHVAMTIYLEKNWGKVDEFPEGNADRIELPVAWGEIVGRMTSGLDYHHRQK